jgi:hypothetical protein
VSVAQNAFDIDLDDDEGGGIAMQVRGEGARL